MKKIALFSAADKTEDMNRFARELLKRGYTIWASGGTYKHFVKEEIEANDIAGIVGKPILNHRVVTLSREIFAGILGDVNSPEDLKELEGLIGGVIEIVYVDLYHLKEAMDEEMDKPNPDLKSLREKVDIGGPSLLRAAGKGDRYVISNTSSFTDVLKSLERDHTKKNYQLETDILKLELAAEAERCVIDHAEAAEHLYHELQAKLEQELEQLESVR